MTPAEAIAALGGIEGARKTIEAADPGAGPFSYPRFEKEHAICALALHALTDSGAQEIRDIPSIDVVGPPDCDIVTEHNFGTNRITVTITRKDLDSGARGALSRAADSEAWVGKLCEDSKARDTDLETILDRFNEWGHMPAGEAAQSAWHAIEDHLRAIMRTRGDALRAAERERDEWKDRFTKAEAAHAAHTVGWCGRYSQGSCSETSDCVTEWCFGCLLESKQEAEAELARLRAEMAKRDEAEPEFPMQAHYDSLKGSLSCDDWYDPIEEMLLWCVRKLGGARG